MPKIACIGEGAQENAHWKDASGHLVLLLQIPQTESRGYGGGSIVYLKFLEALSECIFDGVRRYAQFGCNLPRADTGGKQRGLVDCGIPGGLEQAEVLGGCVPEILMSALELVERPCEGCRPRRRHGKNTGPQEGWIDSSAHRFDRHLRFVHPSR